MEKSSTKNLMLFSNVKFSAEDFFQILWPSQNNRTLTKLAYETPFYHQDDANITVLTNVNVNIVICLVFFFCSFFISNTSSLVHTLLYEERMRNSIYLVFTSFPHSFSGL